MNPTPNSIPVISPSSCGNPALGALAVPLRLGLGGLMMFSGWMKLGFRFLDGALPAPVRDQLDFYFAINGFKMGLHPELTRALSGAIPWAELMAGLLLVVGLWARPAAVVIGAMMLGFMGGIASVIIRGLDAKCPCFGSIKLFCGAEIGACHLVRNSILLAMSLYIVAVGPGPLSIDRLLKRRAI
jgi:uncharacterized membrane protein YphA (DoxX/SURF4 family)